MTVKEINTFVSCIISDINKANECQRIINGDLKGNAECASDIQERCQIRYERLIAVCRMCDIYVLPRYTMNGLIKAIGVKYYDTYKEYNANSVYRFCGV